MKNTEFKNLEKLLEKIKTINLIERIFYWKSIKSLSYDAYKEFKTIDLKIENEIKEYKTEIRIKDNKLENLQKTISDNNKRITILEKERDDKLHELENNIQSYERRKKQIEDEQIEKERKKFEEMKETWKVHEINVENKIKLICKQRQITYISKEKVEFKGKPDNTIKIGDQYIIFDAKSPANDNLSNFPKYIYEQAKKVEKYIKEKNVRKSIYLVVPNNTLEVIKENTINISNYKVYIISINSIEPIIESLQEILNYKYIDKLSQEQRDKIAEIIGKFAHSTKRKIEIDNWINNNFLDILDNCNTLDKKILKKSIEIEKATTLNPIRDNNKRLINNDKLEDDIKIIESKKNIKKLKLPKNRK